jgi:hypothetical protein
VNAIYGLVWLAALWIWGDWKNWQKYYPTILFFLLGDFIYQYLLADHYPMWKYNPQGVDEEIGLTHTHVSFSIMAIKYPATALIYLSRFPEQSKWKQALYIFCWVLLYAVNELLDVNANLIKYYNGWNFWWSIFFNVVMFSILRVHYLKPLLAWLLSIGFIVFLWNIFDVPPHVFR